MADDVDPAVDLALVGAGGAGSLVLLGLAAADPDLSVAVVDPVPHRSWDRTWCSWGRPGDAADALVGTVVEAAWTRLRIDGGGVAARMLDISPLEYRLVRSDRVYALVAERLAAARRLRVTRVPARVSAVAEDVRGAVVTTSQGPLRARWVLDSRPARPARPAGVSWVQSFLGWVLPASSVPAVAGTPVFMDFRTRPPEAGLSFGYCLPLPGDRVLVEYTEFGPRPLRPDAATAALGDYLRLLGTGPGPVPEPFHVEQGAIPMTDAPFPRQAGRSVFRIGTAGGATRPSTGFTFAAMARQAVAVAEALAAGRAPVPPPAYPERHRLMDAALLRALDDGLVDGPAFFRQLFERQPAERVLRFLDGATRPDEEARIMSASPRLAMTRAVLRSLSPPRASSGA